MLANYFHKGDQEELSAIVHSVSMEYFFAQLYGILPFVLHSIQKLVSSRKKHDRMCIISISVLIFFSFLFFFYLDKVCIGLHYIEQSQRGDQYNIAVKYIIYINIYIYILELLSQYIVSACT